MPYVRDSEKQQQQAQSMPQDPAMAPQDPAAAEQDLMARRVRRGQMNPNMPGSPAEGFRMAQEVSNPTEAAALGPEVEATPEEQAEYERAMEALSLILYENEQTSAAIVKQLNPQEKVGSVAKASMLTIQQLDMKFDFDDVVIAQLTEETVDRIIDLYENTQQDEEFTPQEAQGALGATWEGVMEMYGMDEDDYAQLTAGMTEDDFKGYEQQYKQFLGET